MYRPRFRLTLGRLMARVAFAAVDLAALGIIYRAASPAQRVVAVGFGAVLLVPIDLFAVVCHLQVRAIHAALADPARKGPGDILDRCAFLVFAALMLVALGGDAGRRDDADRILRSPIRWGFGVLHTPYKTRQARDVGVRRRPPIRYHMTVK